MSPLCAVLFEILNSFVSTVELKQKQQGQQNKKNLCIIYINTVVVCINKRKAPNYKPDKFSCYVAPQKLPIAFIFNRELLNCFAELSNRSHSQQIFIKYS